jgi:poly(A) polymerase
METSLERGAKKIVRTLREAGFDAVYAGGCVRDLLRGVAPADYDIATSATPGAVQALFPRTVAVGVQFGVVRVMVGRSAYEVATFRADGAYLDGRHPEGVRFCGRQEDAARRDFTINGMFFDPLAGEVIDTVGGQEDLARGVVRAIGDPAARFGEDRLRLLRAIRFACRFGFGGSSARNGGVMGETDSGPARRVVGKRHPRGPGAGGEGAGDPAGPSSGRPPRRPSARPRPARRRFL